MSESISEFIKIKNLQETFKKRGVILGLYPPPIFNICFLGKDAQNYILEHCSRVESQLTASQEKYKKILERN